MREADELPLLAALQRCRDRIGFHMPGHAGGAAFEPWFAEVLPFLDNTEIASLDNLNDPVGPVLRAQQKAAKRAGAGETFFVTTGSTTSMKAAMASVVPAGGRVLLARNVHKSVAHAVAELDLLPDFLPAKDCRHPLPLPDLPDVPGQQDLAAVIITAPDYYGHLIDIAAFADYAHAADACLIVDAAHGAHLGADPLLKHKRALAAGADLVIESAHKTLAALTPGSYLHIAKASIEQKRVDPARVLSMLRIYQTSSPSFLIAASLEYASWLLARDGDRLWRERTGQIAAFKADLPAPLTLFEQAPQDPLRLVIDCAKSHVSARRCEEALTARGIDIEMMDYRHLVLIVSLWQPYDHLKRLQKALNDVMALPADPADRSGDLSPELFAALLKPPVFVCSPRDALFGARRRQRVLPAELAGRIAAEVISPTPPCIPLIWPGERVTAERAALLSSILPPDRPVDVLE